MSGIFSFDKLYLAGKKPLLVRDMLVNFEDILPETSKSSACLDMGGIFVESSLKDRESDICMYSHA